MRFLAAHSIAARLAVSALLWSCVILLIAAVLLSALYRQMSERSFDERLLVYANNIASGLVARANASHELGPMGDPRFELPLSGWYWEVGVPIEENREYYSSKSLFGGRLPRLMNWTDDSGFGKIRHGYGAALDTTPLRIVERDIDMGDGERYVIRVAGPADEIESDLRHFRIALGATFLMLGLALAVSTLFQIRFGLKPLARLRAALADVRKGEAEQIRGEYPEDIAPLADDLNLLIETNREILERARTQVGNLAHALKTPLSVISNEMDAAPPEIATKVREQAGLMRDQVTYHLDRARAAALAGTLGTITDVEPVVEALARTFKKIYRERPLDIALAIPAGTLFRGERQDLEEMVGNLVDNACKWARSNVAVSASVRRDNDRTRVMITIDDDGPGLKDDEHRDVLKRGRRLDETKPGSGLGLSIVGDLAALYRGVLALSPSPLGGLRASLDLPGDARDRS